MSDVELISGACVPAGASCFDTATPVDGILGVGQELVPITDDHDTVLTELYSALMQFDDPARSTGFMITLRDSGGELTLGAYQPDTQVAQLQAALLGRTYPNAISAPVFEKPFEVCWQVGQVAPHCQATTIDTGAPGGILTGAAYERYLFEDDEILEPFVNISLYDPDSDAPFTTWPTDFERRVMSFEQTISDGHLNTGNFIFVNRSMGYEAATGVLHVGGVSGTPSAVSNLRVELDGTATTAAWDAPADDGDAVVSTYLVTMRAADTGEFLAIDTVIADFRTITFTDAPTGTAYTIEVTAMNEYGQDRASPPRPSAPMWFRHRHQHQHQHQHRAQNPRWPRAARRFPAASSPPEAYSPRWALCSFWCPWVCAGWQRDATPEAVKHPLSWARTAWRPPLIESLDGLRAPAGCARVNRRATSARVRQRPDARRTGTRRSTPDRPTPAAASPHPRIDPCRAAP